MKNKWCSSSKGKAVFIDSTETCMSFSYTLLPDTPVGALAVVAMTEKEKEFLWRLDFLSDKKGSSYENNFKTRFGISLCKEKTPLLSEATQQIEEYFKGVRTVFSLPLALFSSFSPIGTPFQHKVWQTLLHIPYGSSCSYGNLAERLALSRGYARAIGNACGANPLPLVIPCHRVVGSGGALGGYSGGIEKKRWLLSFEQSN
ncbi:MAG: methylated-DNA--[protein]-cysteine S-methyltransferase [Treponemataceae bacterium]|nr:methylated-DNA--[protein]-cysteine S-methyltransferase [Treponemataceae bacterium]